MLIILKFGGTSVGCGKRIRGAAEFVAEVVKQGHQVVVVTSAMTKITDSLVGLADKVASPEVGAPPVAVLRTPECENPFGAGGGALAPPGAVADEEAWMTECFGVTRRLEKHHLEAA
jgi:hypothetical protein